MHDWGRTTLSLGEEPLSQRRGRLLAAVSELHQIPEGKLRTRRRGARFKLESYRNGHFIAANPRHKASPEDSEEGPGSRVATGPWVWPRGRHHHPWPSPSRGPAPWTQGRQKPRGLQFPPYRPLTWAWIYLWGEPMLHAPTGDAVCPGPSVPGSEPTSRWQTQHSPPGCPPPGWVRGGHWEVPGEAWAELREAEAEGCPVCPTPAAVGLGHHRVPAQPPGSKGWHSLPGRSGPCLEAEAQVGTPCPHLTPSRSLSLEPHVPDNPTPRLASLSFVL